MDPARAKELIEASGWKLGDDRIYAKGARRLSTVVAVRAGYPERTRWLELVAEQVRACGIELQVAEVPFAAIVRMLDVYPHINAAGPRVAPALRRLLRRLQHDGASRTRSGCTTPASARRPSGHRPSTTSATRMPAVDRLIEAGPERDRSGRSRASIYHQYAVTLSQDLPVIYAWSDLAREGIRASIGTTAPGWPRAGHPDLVPAGGAADERPLAGQPGSGVRPRRPAPGRLPAGGNGRRTGARPRGR